MMRKHLPAFNLHILDIYSCGSPVGFSKFPPVPAKKPALTADAASPPVRSKKRKRVRFNVKHTILGSSFLRRHLRNLVRLLRMGDNIAVFARKQG